MKAIHQVCVKTPEGHVMIWETPDQVKAYASAQRLATMSHVVTFVLSSVVYFEPQLASERQFSSILPDKEDVAAEAIARQFAPKQPITNGSGHSSA